MAHRWRKGKPKTGGRKKGTPNKATLEIKQFAESILTRPKYQARIRRRADEGKLPPHLETLLYHYLCGKPKETMEHSGQINLSVLSQDELNALERILTHAAHA